MMRANPIVELIYEESCPNIKPAREQLLNAFVQAGLRPRWKEWEVKSERSPSYVRQYGSPTILVEGDDVSGLPVGNSADCCRIYPNSDAANGGIPAIEDLVRALRNNPGRPRWRLTWSVLPAVLAALTPKLFCPACWPAYAGILTGMGIPFFNYTPYLLPLTLLFIGFALFILVYKAKRRRGYRPLLLGSAGAALLLIGKFGYNSDTSMYLGLALLVVASFWNSWPVNTSGKREKSCPACH